MRIGKTRVVPHPTLAVSVLAIEDAMDGDGVLSLIEQHAVIAHMETQQPLHADLIAFVVADLLHGETEIGDQLLEGNARAALVEVLSRGGHGSAILVGQFVVIVLNDDFEKFGHGGKLVGTQAVEQFHDMLLIGHRPLL
jgi:hypothetical protein